jgi:basic membrane protein A and related proteins
MKKIICILVSLMMVMQLAACGQNEKPTTSPAESGAQKNSAKVAYITGTGGLGDKSFNDLGNEGIKQLEGEGVSCDVAEPHAVSEIEGLIRNFADAGDYALIVAMGVDSAEPMEKVATDYPKQKFLLIDGKSDLENIRSAEVLQTETGFLAGAYVSLLMKNGVIKSDSDVIGAVGGMDIPLIRGILTGYECGAKYVNPDMKVLTSYVGDWNDPGKASELTAGMYEQGAKVVFQAAGASGMGVIERAKDENLYAIGYDGNQNTIAPDNMAGSAIRGLPAIITETAHDAISGNFNGGYVMYTIKKNGKASQMLTDGSNLSIPDSVLKELEKVQENYASSGLDVPTDPKDVDAFLGKLGTFSK